MTKYFTDKVEINIPGAADLDHRRTWLLAMDAFFNIIPMNVGGDRYPDLTADYGAAFGLMVPEAFVLRCFGREMTHYHLRGDCIGTMSESHNTRGRDGTDSHNVDQFTLDWWVDKPNDCFGFAIEGTLTPRPETFCTWPPARRLRNFRVSASLALADASRLFKNEAAALLQIERALLRSA